MRIPKPVNTVLDWAEGHAGALAAVTALAGAAVAAMWVPVLAGFILGLAVGGFYIHLRLSKRIARARREVDDLLRENGALRHRNTVLASGVITREAQVTQALVSIPEDDPLEDPQRTRQMPTLNDELLGAAAPGVEAPQTEGPDEAPEDTGQGDGLRDDDGLEEEKPEPKAKDEGPATGAKARKNYRPVQEARAGAGDGDPAGELTDLTDFVSTRRRSDSRRP
ncbi:LapA family protein [Spirillospora sp. CA-255316]